MQTSSVREPAPEARRPSLARALAARVTAPVGRLELLVFCCIGVALLTGRLAITHGPALSNDAYQYLSVADNFLAGRPAETSIVHFDVERSWRRVPAPMTTFPPGYPLAIAAVSLLVRPEQAAMLVSLLSALVLLLLYYVVDRTVALGGLATRFLLVWTLGSSQLALWGTAVASESLFTALTCAAVVLFAVARKERQGGRQWLWLVAANVLVGLSYWVRYAGLFFFAAIALYVALLAWRYRDRRALRAVVSLLVSTAIIGAGCLRNQLLVGTWKGGNTTPGRRHLVETVRLFGPSIERVVLGESWRPGLPAVDVLFLLALAPALLWSLKPLLRRRDASEPRADLWWLLVVYTLVYSGAMTYVGFTSVISMAPRMFYPLLPVALLMGAILIARVRGGEGQRQPPAFVLGLALITGAFLALNARNFVVPPPPAPHQFVERELAQEIAPGTSLRAWLAANVPADETIAADRGQATGYVLRRNTVSLVSHVYSNQVWDEAAVRALMQACRARVLILYTDGRPDLAVARESPFLSALVGGRRPAWLAVAARTRDVLVLRRVE